MNLFIKLLLTPILGIFLFFVGFTYDIIFAGIPYQDPTPELQANYVFHSNIASGIYLLGGILFLFGIILIPVILLNRKRKK
jgi:hypothetical protein